MRKNINPVLIIVGLLVILSFMLTGCYTQLSRPRIDTEDEYDTNAEYEGDEYYQDQEAEDSSEQPGGDTYIYNYYPYTDPYFDSWYYYPYSWRYYDWSYLGPYPDFWWDPYGRRWTPGWYFGFSYYDNWWGGYPSHRNPYYGYYPNPSQRTYTKRPFGRRSIDAVDRQQRIVDSQTGLAKPHSPTRVDRPSSTVASPDLRKKPVSDDANRAPNQAKRFRTNPNIKKPGVVDDVRRQTKIKPRVPARGTDSQKESPRSSKTYSKPKMIETAPAKNNNTDNSRSYKPTPRSENRNSTPSRSNDSQVSKPATRSSEPRSSATPRSSSPSTSSKESSSSKSSGSSKTEKK